LSDLLQRHPDLVPARLLLSGVLLAQGRLRDACEQLCRAVPALPPDPDLIYRVAQASNSLGETNATLACLRHPAIAALRSGQALVALAHIHQALGQHAEALALMERARALGYDAPDFRYYLGLQLQFNGRLREAEDEMETCLRMGSTIGRASLSLSRIRRQTPERNHVAFLRARLAAATADSEDRASLAFALHKELDDLGATDEAWDALRLGNDVMRRIAYRYDAREETALFDALIARFPEPVAAPPADAPRDGPTPIFIVGLPRSGTTLLERMLGNHSQVTPTGELKDLPRQLRWTAGRHGQAVLDRDLLDAAATIDYPLLGRRYLEQSGWRARGRAYYIDKLPPNFMLLGHIRRALPQARIVHMVRDPMDVCFSNYRAMFGDAFTYSYGIDSLAHHYRQYARLMAHWRRVLPGFVLDLPYDRVVRDTESACRTLLDFCGLPFEPQCLDTARNTAAVATLSSAQVRQPIHARALGEWRRYERQLAPLAAALGEA
jgi:tetratricopeptide (TPR) repeat protein